MPKYTNYTAGFKGTLDHLLYDQNSLQVLQLLEIPNEKHVARETALPNTEFPSDHVRIEAIFMLK